MKSTYTCDCGRSHHVPMYAVAQAAMGHRVTHHCVCGRRNTYTGGQMRIGALPTRVLLATTALAKGDERQSWHLLLDAAQVGDLPEES